MNQAKMTRTILIVAGILLVGFLTYWFLPGLFGRDTGQGISSRATSKPDAKREIVVHCGNSMRLAAEELSDIYREGHNLGIRFNFGGSDQLFAAIDLTHEGDILLCHDPFADKLVEEGLGDSYVTVGYLEPIIITRKGNPYKIKSLVDLTKKKLKIGNSDPRYTTCGELLIDKLEEKRLLKAYKKNVRLEEREHNNIALAVKAGHLDAGVVWNFIGTVYAGDVAVVDTGEEFDETRVTLVLLKHSEHKSDAQNFIDFCASERGQEVWQKYGYTKSSD